MSAFYPGAYPIRSYGEGPESAGPAFAHFCGRSTAMGCFWLEPIILSKAVTAVLDRLLHALRPGWRRHLPHYL